MWIQFYFINECLHVCIQKVSHSAIWIPLYFTSTEVILSCVCMIELKNSVIQLRGFISVIMLSSLCLVPIFCL